MVTLMKFYTTDAPGHQYSVGIDSTMTQLTIQVQVEKSMPVMFTTMANGN